jgi:6-phosphogluconolactonase
MSSPVIHRTPFFAKVAAQLIVDAARSALSERGVFRLGLAGGNTPKIVHQELVRIGVDLPWDKVVITFGDERCVPPDHADSNYRMGRESLLDHVPVLESNVLRIRGELDPALAASECEEQLNRLAQQRGESIYSHDLLMLGLGEDGHTASLFPGSPALDESSRMVIPTLGPKPPPQRITFTYPLLNASRAVLFLVNDPAKEPVVQAVLQGEFPAGRVRPVHGTVSWVLGER